MRKFTVRQFGMWRGEIVGGSVVERMEGKMMTNPVPKRSEDCPFCGNDPFEYVDIGVGMQPVAINCCDLGILYFEGAEEVTISAETFNSIADVLGAMRTLGMSPEVKQ